MVNWLAQVFSVTWMNLREIPGRPSSSIVSLVGIAGVVTVFVAVLSISAGFRQTLAAAGIEDTAIVLRGGSNAELSSGLSQESVRLIAEAPGIAVVGDEPQSSAELYVVVDVPKISTGTGANVPLRGVEGPAFAVRRNLSIVEGRRFTPGLNEVVVGRSAQGQFAGLELGATLEWGRNVWTVVGVFEDDGSVSESEIWCDVKVLQGAYNRGTSYQSVRVQLESADAFQTFKDALTQDPRLNVSVERETDYYAAQSSVLAGIINSLGSVVALLMGMGAVFGAILTMYSAVSARTREIATLRALGFGALPIVISVLTEALILGALGGVFGAVVAFVGFNGYQTSTINFQSFSQVSFAFRVTPLLLGIGVLYALAMGFIGGVLPSWKAARQPITTGLREL